MPIIQLLINAITEQTELPRRATRSQRPLSKGQTQRREPLNKFFICGYRNSHDAHPAQPDYDGRHGRDFRKGRR